MVTVGLGGCANEPRDARLVLEGAVGRTGLHELVASVDPGDDARAPRAGDAVRLRCDDVAGSSLLTAEGALTDDGGSLLPHLHYAMTADDVTSIAACVATADGSVLRGTVGRR